MGNKDDQWEYALKTNEGKRGVYEDNDEVMTPLEVFLRRESWDPRHRLGEVYGRHDVGS